MDYLALYRKWRPQIFEDIIGQDHITRTLKSAVKSGRVSHAYLFCGPRGTGKTSAAKILAKALNCENGPTPTPCNECSLCLGINRGRVMDVLEIDAASNRGIDEIRELRDKVRYGSAQARFKVYIIDEVHMLTPEAFNALLKTLEEPPENVVFILATTEPFKLPQTILSRCQRFDFRRIPIPVMVQGLSRVASGEGTAVEEEVLHLIARSSEGGMRDALGLLEQVMAYSGHNVTLESAKSILGVVEEEIFVKLGQAVLTNNLVKGLKITEDVVDSGHDIGKFLRDMSSYFRSLVLLKMQGQGPTQLDIPWSSKDVMREQSKEFHHEAMMSVIEYLGEAISDLRGSSQPRFVLEMAVFKICQVDYHLNLKNLQQKMEALEKLVLEGYGSSPEGEKARGERPPEACEFQYPPSEEVSASEPGKEKEVNTGFQLEEEGPQGALAETTKTPGGADAQSSLPKAASSEDDAEPVHTEEENISHDEIRGIWKKLLEMLSHKNVKIHSMLSRGKPVSFEEGILTVAVENFICKEKLSSKDNTIIIKESFQRLTGREIRFDFVLKGVDAGENENIEEDYYVEDIDRGLVESSNIRPLGGEGEDLEINKDCPVERAAEMFGGKIIDADKNKRGGIFDV